MRDMFLRRRRYWDVWTQGNWASKFPEWWNNYTYFYKDAAAAYQLALRWKLEGDVACGQTAVKILNAWAETCKGLVRVKSLANDRTYDANGEIADRTNILFLLMSTKWLMLPKLCVRMRRSSQKLNCRRSRQ